MAEWFKALVLKTSDGQPSVSSNPTASAILSIDHDEQGLKQVKSGNFDLINNHVYVSRSNPNIYAILLPVPEEGFAK
ncbi:MAG: hypothetical protein K0R66_310 [Gammaproteobacteria bacterium]|nr:hypothetical protein [Gammaproteobacteria bacterium]